MWHVIGNGPGTVHCGQQERRVRFNQPIPKDDCNCLTICNGNLVGSYMPFVVHGELQEDGFPERLSAHARDLELELGCWPSSGLTALSCLLEPGSSLKVSAMNLLPSLVRSSVWGTRQPLPAAFHNWLGERRVAQGWLSRLEWPTYWLECPTPAIEGEAASFERLQALPFLSRDLAMMEWRTLASVDVQRWYEIATEDRLKAIEGLFFLPRGQRETSLWWMYDSVASSYVNRVRFALAVAQQRLLSVMPMPSC
jgi:hypothetical protein